VATQTSRILINQLLCKGEIYCALCKAAALQKRVTAVHVIKRQPQHTPAFRHKRSLGPYRHVTSLNKDRRKSLGGRGKRGSKSQRHILHSNLPSPWLWGPFMCWKGSRREGLLALSSRDLGHTKAP